MGEIQLAVVTDRCPLIAVFREPFHQVLVLLLGPELTDTLVGAGSGCYCQLGCVVFELCGDSKVCAEVVCDRFLL